jgi:hypothetical protein
VTSQAREWLKWIALVLMTGDHINAALLGRNVDVLFALGRVVMPIFAAVVAYGIGCADSAAGGRYHRLLRRLCVVGALAYPFHVLALGQGWAVGNILWGYAIAVAAAWAVDARGKAGIALAVLLVLVGGCFVEFYWAGPLVTLAWWWFWRSEDGRHGLVALVAVFAATSLLCVINGNPWAMFAIPIVLLMRDVEWPIKRRPWAFYVYYPAHLAALVAITAVAGS